MIRIVIADDHPVVLAGLTQILAAESDVEVVASCASGEAALDSVQRHSPDLLVVDLRMPGRDGLDVLAELTRRASRPAVILLTAVLDANEMTRAIALGVEGIVLKEAAPQLLVDAARRVAAGEKVLDSPELRRILRKRSDGGDVALLTPRELEIAWKTAQGESPAEIAEDLELTEGAVKVHLDRIKKKLGREKLDVRESLLEGGNGELDEETTASTEADDLREPSLEAKKLQRRFGLTPREAVVGALLAEGLSNKEIAQRLNISLNTVKTHIAAVHAKAEVTSTRKLMVVLRGES